jgi:hypothetical protein
VRGIGLHHEHVGAPAPHEIGVSLACRLGEYRGRRAVKGFPGKTKIERAVQHHRYARALVAVTGQQRLGGEPGLDNAEAVQLE